jgi:hypothetical protein
MTANFADRGTRDSLIAHSVDALREGLSSAVDRAVPGDTWAANAVRVGLRLGVAVVVRIVSTKPLAFACACERIGIVICPDPDKCTCGAEDTLGILGRIAGGDVGTLLRPH